MKIISLLVLLALIIISCGKDAGVAQATGDCYLPEGTALTTDQRYIKGSVSLPIGGGATTPINLYVQRVEKLSSGAWGTNTLETFESTGKTPCQTFDEMKSLWQEFYQDMVDAGLHADVIKYYASGISNLNDDANRVNSGVYGETGLGSCGYAGAVGTITCVAAATTGVKQYYMAHENTHAFQWDFTLSDISVQNILFYRIFAAYANSLYHQSLADDSVFSDADGRWNIALTDYALQNEAEWIAEIFRNYLYAGAMQWDYINNNHNDLASFFNCVWKEGKSFTTCQTETIVAAVAYAETVPVVNIPVYSGLTSAQSEAIWNVCFDTANKESHRTVFNDLINTLVPDLYVDAADSYELGYGDCNHDGVLDWVCTYEGSAPGGGNYLWNTANQVGAYTFIASGKSGDSYAEYKQDPYLEDSGTLVRPEYREWEGTYGSCNGSMKFQRVPTRFVDFASGVSGLPSDLQGKDDW